MTEEEKIVRAKETNVKIYPIYKLFAWDLLFYYSTIFLFANQVKGLTASEIFIGNAFYLISKLIFQPFVPIIINIVGKRKGTIIGNIFVSLSILHLILVPGNVMNYIITNLIMSIGYVFKDVCESTILDDCILDRENKNSIFAKIDGRGSAYWYIFEAISSVSTGFLFVINAYIPIYLCFIFCIIGTLLSFRLEHYEVKVKKEKNEHPIKRMMYKINMAKQEYLFVFKSKRLRALMMFSGLFYAMLNIRSTITSSMLVDIGIEDKYFGIIFGVFTVFTVITTWKQNWFHRRFHNKVLTLFSLTFSISLILMALTAIININYILTLVIVFAMMIIQNMLKGPYHTLIKRYLNSFSNEKLSVKIYSVNNFINDIVGALVSLGVSALLNYTTTAYTSLIIGVIALILFINILDYMKTRIGLKVEEYREEDIHFVPKLNEPTRERTIEIKVGMNEDGETIMKVN